MAGSLSKEAQLGSSQAWQWRAVKRSHCHQQCKGDKRSLTAGCGQGLHAVLPLESQGQGFKDHTLRPFICQNTGKLLSMASTTDAPIPIVMEVLSGGEGHKTSAEAHTLMLSAPGH